MSLGYILLSAGILTVNIGIMHWSWRFMHKKMKELEEVCNSKTNKKE